MKVTVKVGEVVVTVDGLDLTERQVRRLVTLAGQIAGSLVDNSPDSEPEERPPVGFAAHVERATGLPPEYQFTDDE